MVFTRPPILIASSVIGNLRNIGADTAVEGRITTTQLPELAPLLEEFGGGCIVASPRSPGSGQFSWCAL